MNTVTLHLTRYHELLSYEERSIEPKQHTIVIKGDFFCGNIRVESDEESVKFLAEELKTTTELLILETEISNTLETENETLKKELAKYMCDSFFSYIKLFFYKRQ